MTNETRNVSIITLTAVFGILLIVVLFSSFGAVGAGERGVVVNLGEVTGEIKGEGFYVKAPFIQSVVKMDVQIQKEEVVAGAASRDLQSVSATIALNYRVRPDATAVIYQDMRRDYKVRVVQPAIQEAVKAGTAQFNAEELVTKRTEVRDTISTLIREKLEPRGIDMIDFNIIDFQFSASFDSAIESKVTAEQEALRARNDLERVKFEAEQRIVQSQAEAEAIRIQAEAVTSQGGAEYVQLQAISKWNGVLPQYTGGGAVPFINVN